jgi:hypothetical protein
MNRYTQTGYQNVMDFDGWSFVIYRLMSFVRSKHFHMKPWRHGLVESSPTATEETEAMGREIESRQGIEWY